MEITLTTEQDPTDSSKLQLYGEVAIRPLLSRLNQLKHSHQSDFHAIAVAFITWTFDPLGEAGQACHLRIWNARHTGHKGQAAAADREAESHIIAFNMKQRRASHRKNERLIYVRQEHVEKARIRRVIQALTELAQERGYVIDRVGLLLCKPGKVWQARLTLPR
ncbi:MAG: hypothetical protein AB7O43_08735 [Hyphomicrobiaceae bacterium]